MLKSHCPPISSRFLFRVTLLKKDLSLVVAQFRKDHLHTVPAGYDANKEDAGVDSKNARDQRMNGIFRDSAKERLATGPKKSSGGKKRKGSGKK